LTNLCPYRGNWATSRGCALFHKTTLSEAAKETVYVLTVSKMMHGTYIVLAKSVSSGSDLLALLHLYFKDVICLDHCINKHSTSLGAPVAEGADMVMKTVYHDNEHIVGNEKYSWVYLCKEDLAVTAKSLNMYAESVMTI